MDTPDQTHDKKINELKLQIERLQQEVHRAEKEKEKESRFDFLVKNSTPMSAISLEYHNGLFFILGNDNKNTYAMRLSKEQAEVLADDLDHELGKTKVDELFQSEMVRRLISPFLKQNE
jgi:hypothetical protein